MKLKLNDSGEKQAWREGRFLHVNKQCDEHTISVTCVPFSYCD